MHWSARSNWGRPRTDGERLRALALGAERSRPGAIDLSCSNPLRVGLELPDFSDELFCGARSPYEPHPLGLAVARKAVAETYNSRGLAFGHEQVCLLSSTSEGYSLLFQLLCDPGDSVLAPSPSYPLLEHLAQLSGVHLRPYRLRFAGEWELDASSLPDSHQIREQRIRAVVGISPNNPTGNQLDEKQWAALGRLGLPLIVDEVFRPYRFVTDWSEPPGADLVFTLDGLSKRAAAPGLKLGWVAAWGQRDLVAEAMHRLEILADTFLSTNGPVQRALPSILQREEEVQALIQARLEETLCVVQDTLAGTALTFLAPQGGWSGIIRCPLVREESVWWEQLARRGVWLLPGEMFSLPLTPAFVVSLLTPPDQMRKGLAKACEVARDFGCE